MLSAGYFGINDEQLNLIFHEIILKRMDSLFCRMLRSKIVILAAFFFTFRAELCAGVIGQESDYIVKDQAVGHLHKPYAKIEYNWPEYKGGKIILKTNNFGFREDADTKINITKGVIRILVTGDSHIDGVVNNNESFPHVLESKLNLTSQPSKFEILNGGVGYYGPDQYFLFLHKYLFLKPDIYIVVIYTGNDFLDTARIVEAKDGPKQRPKKYNDALRNCMWSDAVISQVMNQIFYFKTFPEMKEKTVQRTLELLLKISNYCKIYKIDFIVLLLPTKADVEWQSDRNVIEKTKDCLCLTESDLNINRELTEALIKGISKNNISFLDLYQDMKNQSTEFYWRKDYHLSVQGHNFLAEKVFEKYRNFFSQRKRNTYFWERFTK